MASPDVRFEQRAVVIEFLVAKNIKRVDIYRRLLSVYGNGTQEISSVCHWILAIECSEVGKAIFFPIKIDVDGQ